MLIIGFVCATQVACATPRLRSDGADEPSRPDTFKVLTYNTLHGLDVTRGWVRAGETVEMRRARFEHRIRDIAAARPDLIFLQEVNPLPEVADEYVRALGDFGLAYTEVHQVDACGLRVAPGLAAIPALNNGLMILARAPLRLRKLTGVKLSGGFGGCQDWWGVQFGEFRYALIADVYDPRTSMRYLVATTHLHSGIERDAHVLRELMTAHEQGRLRRFHELTKRLEQGQDRRRMELRALLNELRAYQAGETYAGVIVGGDMNFEPGSTEFQELERWGFQDTHRIAMPVHMLHTYDPEDNPLAGRDEDTLPPELAEAIAGESPEDQREVLRRYRTAVRMSRRIDFLFSMSFMQEACLMQDLIGRSKRMGDAAGSDHYGVLNTYSYRMGRC